MKNCSCAEKKRDENASLQDELKDTEDQVKREKNESERLTKSFTEKDNQLISTQEQLKETEQKLTSLEIEEKKKEDEIVSLTGSLAKSEIEATELKKTSKQDELNKLTDELNIDRSFKKRLKNDYDQLVKAKKNWKEDLIDEAEENIKEIGEELREKGISRDNIRRVCGLYEEIANLQLDLKQKRSELQQYEARIEIPLHQI